MPHLPAGEDRTIEPLGHALLVDAQALGELLPRQTCKFDQPLQALAEVLREGRGATVLLPFHFVHSHTSLFSMSTDARSGGSCVAVPQKYH